MLWHSVQISEQLRLSMAALDLYRGDEVMTMGI
jgi:hypothetical protein